MFFILGASSLHHALRTQPKQEQQQLSQRVRAIPGLSFNTHSVNIRKTVQYQLPEFLPHHEYLIWLDFINNSISEHASNNNRPLSLDELLQVLSIYRNRIVAIVYCQRTNTKHIYPLLKKSGILIINFVRDLLPKNKRRLPKIVAEYPPLHQKSNVELKTFRVISHNMRNLKMLPQQRHPNKRLSKGRRKRFKKESEPVSVLQFPLCDV